MIFTQRELFTLITLCFINTVNYMDRYTVAGVLVDVQTYYKIDDELGGLVQTGFVFAYMISSPFFGYLGDRISRMKLLMFCVTWWSSMVLIASFMEKYMWFLVFRSSIGIGEAGYSVIAPTVLSDIAIKNDRSTMLAYFYFAIPVGAGLGYIVSSTIAAMTGKWWWGLRLTPVLGIIGVFLIPFCVFLNRGEKEIAAAGGKPLETTSYKEDVIYLLKNRSYIFITLAFTAVSFITGALAWWGPKFIWAGFNTSNTKNDSLASVAFVFGIITVLTGIFGVFLGSHLSKELRTTWAFVDPVICGIGMFFSIPTLAASMLYPYINKVATFIFVAMVQISLNIGWPIMADITLYITIPTRRSSGQAIQMLLMHAFGDCCSPYIIGALTEYFKDDWVFEMGAFPIHNSNATVNEDNQEFHSLQMSLMLLTFIQVFGIIMFLFCGLYVVSDRTAADNVIANEEKNH